MQFYKQKKAPHHTGEAENYKIVSSKKLQRIFPT